MRINDEIQEQRAMKAALRSPLLMHLRDGNHHERISFTLPGNVNGLLYPNFLKSDYLAYDLTELSVTEDLNDPGTAIRKAELQAAQAYGAKDCVFVTLGSSVAIKAAIGGAVGRQGTLLTAPDVHKSALQAAQLLDLGLIFLDLDTIENPDNLPKLLERYPEISAVYLTTPDFYGHCYDIRAIAEILKNSSVLLIVDSAHGAHFPFAPKMLPISAIEAGADLVVCSAHKTLPAPTPTSLLLVGNNLENKRPDLNSRKLRQLAATFTSTSPPLMLGVGLDFAVSYMDLYGEEETHRLLEMINDFVAKLPPELQRVELGISSQSKPLPPEYMEKVANLEARPLHDPLRIVIDCADVCPGPLLDDDLAERGINVEMADLCRIVLIPHFGQSADDFAATNAAIDELVADYRTRTWPEEFKTANLRRLDSYYRQRLGVPAFSAKAYHPAKMLNLDWHLDTEWVKLHDACNRNVAEALIPYPPGIPLLWPGDKLKNDDIELFESLIAHGLKVHGTRIVDGEILVPILKSAPENFEASLEY